MEEKAQGAIDYLLIIGAAILVVAIVILAITGALNNSGVNGQLGSAQSMQSSAWSSLAAQ
ncbi:MAG: class III signal peptide [Candidatus Diapherotrites archaeon]|nr:class III signal peptide [Candidatus Diapherotrites archaeon]